jgi:hypothetical protein
MMNKFVLKLVLFTVPTMAFASGIATHDHMTFPKPARTCTTHALLVQKIDHVYHTKFPTRCTPVST